MGVMDNPYLQQLQQLLPSGSAWPRDVGSALTKLLSAIAEEMARIDGRALQLIDEADPRTTVDMLGDWERVAGLPDNCSGLLADSQQGRRNELVSKLVGRGGQSRAYFIELAKAFGFDITIEEFRPFRAGSRAGDPLSNGDWRFTWRVRAPAVTVRRFRAGQSAAGELLASWGNAGLECRIRKFAPSHTGVLFAYGPKHFGVLLLPDGQPLVTAGGQHGLLLE